MPYRVRTRRDVNNQPLESVRASGKSSRSGGHRVEFRLHQADAVRGAAPWPIRDVTILRCWTLTTACHVTESRCRGRCAFGVILHAPDHVVRAIHFQRDMLRHDMTCRTPHVRTCVCHVFTGLYLWRTKHGAV
jgi:hypothetical protein